MPEGTSASAFKLVVTVIILFTTRIFQNNIINNCSNGIRNVCIINFSRADINFLRCCSRTLQHQHRLSIVIHTQQYLGCMSGALPHINSNGTLNLHGRLACIIQKHGDICSRRQRSRHRLMETTKRGSKQKHVSLCSSELTACSNQHTGIRQRQHVTKEEDTLKCQAFCIFAVAANACDDVHSFCQDHLKDRGTKHHP